MITTWRIVSAEYADTAFTGKSASLAGGRWNSPGTPVVYTSSTASLAALELLVHLRRHHSQLHGRVIFACTFAEKLFAEVEPDTLPANWLDPQPPQALRDIGDAWVKSGRSAVLRVPSVIIATESNYILNPDHRDFTQITIADPAPFSLDTRLLRR